MSNPFNYQATERDWPEDFEHDNGMYMNGCLTCKNTFIGYKRRHTCKVCANDAAALQANFKAAQEKFERLTEEYQRVHNEFVAARTRRDELCQHEDVGQDSQYYSGGYDYTDRTEYWKWCKCCKKTLESWTKQGSSYG